MFRATLLAALSLPLSACFAQTPTPAKPQPAATGGTEAAPVPGATPVAAATPAATPAAAKVTYSQCHVEGNYVAMTFDDGPSAENTPRLLDMLKKRNIKATFFVVGKCAAEYPDIMKRIVAEGHEVASHSWSHPLLSKMSEGSVTEELQRTHDTILQITGVAPKVMRPPYGGFTQTQRAWANKKWGYKIILWDVDPLDWKVRNAAHVESEIMKATVSGSIILSHDIHKTTVDAMPSTLDALAAKGFKFATVSELLAMDRPAAPTVKATPGAPVVKATPAPVVKATPAPVAGAGVAPAAVAAPAAPAAAVAPVPAR